MRNIDKNELIGLDIEICEAKNKSNIGIKGRIVDETQHTIIVQVGNQKKRLIKKEVSFITKINNRTVKINGKIVVGRPHERIKKK